MKLIVAVNGLDCRKGSKRAGVVQQENKGFSGLTRS